MPFAATWKELKEFMKREVIKKLKKTNLFVKFKKISKGCGCQEN